MNQPAILLQDLGKRFEGVMAVDGASLEIEVEELFGLLGPNGAGKSTIIKMLATMIKPSGGTAKIYGHDIILEKNLIRSFIGVVFQDATLDGRLTGRENLDFHARLYGLDRDTRLNRIDEVLELVDLRDRADLLVSKYSGGMQRRLAIARGLINHPKVLILDEPTLGLDAQTRHHIWEYISDLNIREDLTIILTTHYMEEADHLCDRVAIIDHGKIVALDAPQELKNSAGSDRIIMHVLNGSETLMEALSSFPWIISSEASNGQIVLQVEDAQSRIPQVIIEACMNNAQVASVEVTKPTLEDVFIRVTGRSMKERESLGDPMSEKYHRRWR